MVADRINKIDNILLDQIRHFNILLLSVLIPEGILVFFIYLSKSFLVFHSFVGLHITQLSDLILNFFSHFSVLFLAFVEDGADELEGIKAVADFVVLLFLHLGHPIALVVLGKALRLSVVF